MAARGLPAIIMFVVITNFLLITAVSGGNFGMESEECGKSNIDNIRMNKMLNAKEANSREFPWEVSVIIEHGEWITVCGGSLILSDVVVTASHCVDDLKISSSNVAIFLGLEYQRFFSVKRTACAIVYRPTEYDIAVIKLSSPVKYSSFIQTVCMPPKSLNDSTILNGKTVKAIGMGRTETGELSRTLKKTEMEVIPFDDCYEAFNDGQLFDDGSDIDAHLKRNEHICAIVKEDLGMVCYGDSGSGLIYKSEDKWRLVGIASFVQGASNGLCNVTYPATFSDVIMLSDYIEEMVKHVKNAPCGLPPMNMKDLYKRGGWSAKPEAPTSTRADPIASTTSEGTTTPTTATTTESTTSSAITNATDSSPSTDEANPTNLTTAAIEFSAEEASSSNITTIKVKPEPVAHRIAPVAQFSHLLSMVWFNHFANY